MKATESQRVARDASFNCLSSGLTGGNHQYEILPEKSTSFPDLCVLQICKVYWKNIYYAKDYNQIKVSLNYVSKSLREMEKVENVEYSIPTK